MKIHQSCIPRRGLAPESPMDIASPTASLLEEDYFNEIAAFARLHARRRLLTDDVEDITQDVVLTALERLRVGGLPMITRGLSGYVDLLVGRRIYNGFRTDGR